MVWGMQNILHLPGRSNEPRPMAGNDRIDPEAARMNPWLLWRPKRPARTHVLSVAELAECTCPELCHRDHGNE
jgi:hypothetical protein